MYYYLSTARHWIAVLFKQSPATNKIMKPENKNSTSKMCREKNLLTSLLIFLLLKFCISIDTITLDKPLKDGDVLISEGENFALGFFSAGSSSSRYVGIWYNKVSEQTVIWVANRNSPITDKSGVLSVNQTGNLALYGQNEEIPFWSTKVSGKVNGSSYSAQLLDTGNLVLFYGNSNKNIAWQSFDYPTNNLISNMKIGVDRRTGLKWQLTSWKSPDDPATGEYSYEIDINGSVPQLFLYKNSGRLWRGGPWNGLRWSGIATAGKPLPPDFLFNSTFIDNDNEYSVMYANDASVLSRIVLNETSGVIQRLLWSEEEQRWVGYWSAPKDQCDNYAHCGAFGNCNPYNVGEFGCKCLPGFQPKSERDWYLRDGSDGCVRQRAGQVCGAGDGFLKVPGLKVPDATSAHVNMSLEIKGCEEMCLTNCMCTAYASADVSRGGNGCIMWYGDLVDIRELPNGGQDVFVRVDAVTLAEYSKKSKRFNGHVKVVIVILSIAAVLSTLLLAYWLVVRKRRVRKSIERHHKQLIGPEDSGITSFGGSPRRVEINENGTSADVQFFSLSTIIAATGDFSFANKLGEGGFGTVYKGQLFDGQEIAVKRLSNSSKQGTEEFRNEVTLIAKLQHKNLVRLFGYCIEKKEKMLIYEYLPNKGLDCFIFGKAKGSMLDWKKRFDITLGIARGMLYLHQDSRLRIIHRDLKASNILLDASMNPKISDFGMARIFGPDQMEETTKRVVGTYGYMSPEYAMEGIFSIKSDVFSFGVLHLEIISGRRNMTCYQENSVNLIGHVWDLWREGKSLEIVDPTLCESYDVREALRCIHIGLLCVQESADIRPTMSEVVFMLCNETTLPSPSQPAFINRRPDTGPAHLSFVSVGADSNNEMTVSMMQGR